MPSNPSDKKSTTDQKIEASQKSDSPRAKLSGKQIGEQQVAMAAESARLEREKQLQKKLLPGLGDDWLKLTDTNYQKPAATDAINTHSQLPQDALNALDERLNALEKRKQREPD
jgi:hypothetical protein